MAGKASRRRKPQPDPRPAASGVFAEIEQLLDAPLAELLGSEQERAAAAEAAAQAAAAPALVRLREAVAFIGSGRPVTEAGHLRPADARALADHLGTDPQVVGDVRTLDDLPDTATTFRWAVACEFLTVRRTKVLAGPMAPELRSDPLSAWIRACLSVLEHGLVGGFHHGWRKCYLELLDEAVPAWVLALAVYGPQPMSRLVEDAWQLVCDAHGYAPDDQAERDQVVRLVGAAAWELANLGVVRRQDQDQDLEVTALGETLAGIIASMDEDLTDRH